MLIPPKTNCTSAMDLTIQPERCVRSSIQLRPALFHELCALGEVGEHELTELLGRAAHRLRAVGDDALAHVGPVEDFDELVVKPRDDRRGQARGPDHAVPADEFESWELF